MQHACFCPKEHDVFNIHFVINSFAYHMDKVFIHSVYSSYTHTREITCPEAFPFKSFISYFSYLFLANRWLEISVSANTSCSGKMRCPYFFLSLFSTLWRYDAKSEAYTLKRRDKQHSSDNPTFSRILSKSSYSRKQTHGYNQCQGTDLPSPHTFCFRNPCQHDPHTYTHVGTANGDRNDHT